MTQRIAIRDPNIVIVGGGPHIRTTTEGILTYLKKNPLIDYYCMFEGEYPLGELIGHFLSKGFAIKPKDFDIFVESLAYLSCGELIYTAPGNKPRNINDIPSAYLSGALDEFLDSTQWVPLLETNRGCPFHCTFCVWGISALDNVRVFSLERIFEEIKYISRRSPSSRWIFSDANFGMLGRDVEIAREIRKTADQHGKLRHLMIWWAKNASQHTVEIAHILKDLADPLAAVQSMDDTVLKAIKRDNIKLKTMTDLLTAFHNDGRRASTDVLLGLPGESKMSHLKTLSKVFELGFDHIDVGNIRLLPGSEMEEDKTRREFQLGTRYRLISGSYGLYDDQPILEFEESVRWTRDITEKEMLSLRLVHFYIWALWNLGIAKPLLKWAILHGLCNPLDLILKLTDSKTNPLLKEFIEEFNREASEEWFETSEELTVYYSKNFKELISNGFLKMNFKYLAQILLNPDFALNLLDSIEKHIVTPSTQEIKQFCFDRIYFLSEPLPSKEKVYTKHLVKSLQKIFPALVVNSNKCYFEIEKRIEHAIQVELKKFDYQKNPVRGLALTLETYRSHFLYDFTFDEQNRVKESVGDMTGSFDYHAPLGKPKLKSSNLSDAEKP
jgi:radical SAM superfamily enzyme YgiQ (UPF0313 family)